MPGKRILSITFALVTYLSVFSQPSQPEPGFLDLRGKYEEINLDGQWLFSWKTLNSSSIPRGAGKPVTFPKYWLDSLGYATYTVQVALDRNKDWAMYIPPAYSSQRVFLNGRILAESGRVDTSRALYQPKWIHHTVAITHEMLMDTNELVVQVANFDHDKSGPTNSLVVGPKDWMLKKHELIESLDIFLSGAMVMGGLFFLGLFLYGRQQVNVLYFSLLCISFSYYVIGSGNHALHSLFPELSWYLTIRAEYSSLYLAVFFLTMFIQYTYPKEVNKRFVKVLAGSNLVFLAFALFTSVSFFTWAHQYYLVITLVMTVSALYVNFMAVFRRRTGAKHSLIALILLLLALALRALNILGLVDYYLFLVPLGYLCFFFLHSLTLSQQFAEVWKQAKEDAEASLRAKSEFLSIMSHEIRTPLNAVTGLVHHLSIGKPRADQVEIIDGLQFSAENLISLVNNVLDFNKIEAGKISFSYSSFDLKKLGDQLIGGFKSHTDGQEIGLVLESNFEQLLVHTDKGKLTQVLFNLMDNAIKFTKKGEVCLSMNRIKGNEELKGSEALLTVEFKVIDTGIGIEKSKIGQIFESFSQADPGIHEQYGGSGLGLSICKKLLDLQGVELHVQSEVGQGSAFSFVQKFKATEGDQFGIIEPVQEDGVERLHGKKVLLVEDNPMNVLVVERFLKNWKMQMTHAMNGYIALELISEGFDIVLMDLQMPGITGLEVSKTLREKGINIPIVALTAAASGDMLDRIKEVGMNDFVIKPFHPDELQQKMVTYLSLST